MLTIDTSHTSPNHSSRANAPIAMLVLHATAGSYASALAHLCDPAPGGDLLKAVSAHFLISKAGHIAQLVPVALAAWHAGASSWRRPDGTPMDSADIRDSSIGIELENLNTGSDPYPQAQYDALLWLCRDHLKSYGIVRAMYARHKDIAPKRKTDPAGFPWERFLNNVFAVSVYRTKYRCAVYEQQKGRGPAWGVIEANTSVVIDRADYPEGTAHLATNEGFVMREDIEPL